MMLSTKSTRAIAQSKVSTFLSLLLLLVVGHLSNVNAQSPTTETKVEYALALHGGAGWEPAKLSPTDRQQHEVALRRALEAGRKILVDGGTSMDAVETTIRELEDEPLYNAGRGAVFNNMGQHELDAAIMDGQSRRAGAVAGVTTIKNPISLARLVMSQTSHVLLIGDGAEKFADELTGHRQLERVPNSYFSTEFRRLEWEQAKRKAADAATNKTNADSPTPKPPATKPPAAKPLNAAGSGSKGTVGCVALDRHGNLASGTSTGGLTNKKWGRVGAVPVIGAGTYADNRTCAFSGTGTGEEFLLNSAAFQVHAMMQMQGKSLEVAATELVDKIMPEDSCGIISIDAKGRIFMRCNTPGMARAAVDSTGKTIVQIDR